MSEIKISRDKTLKLSNILVRKMDLKKEEDLIAAQTIISQIDTTIRTLGAEPVGPIIQFNENIDPIYSNSSVKIMQQVSKFFDVVPKPYYMEPELRVEGCMFAKFKGESNKIIFAYQKIQIMAYEQSIPLKGSCYTILLNDKNDGLIDADIFMETCD